MRKSALFAFALVVAALVALGLIVLFSASEANGIRLHKDAYFFLKRQFIYLGAGIFVALFTALVDYRRWRDIPGISWVLYVGVFVLLVLVLPYCGGREINGSYRWLSLGPVNIQPSELAKLAVVIVTAVWMDRCGWRVELIGKGLFVPGMLIGLYASLVILEPDFGSVMVLCAAGGLVMFVAGVRMRHLIPAGLAGAAAAGVVMCFNANRMRRLLAFINSSHDQAEKVSTATMDAAAYQAHMALVAIKNGGLWGVGLGESIQKQYYLPECHTDFIFAVGAEELGLAFSIIVVLLFLAFFLISVYIARNASDRFGRFLVIGMSFVIFFQAMFNLGVVCEALPTKGMALPFFSYGGTNLLSAFFAVGTILSVGIHSYRDKKRVLARSVLTR
ncbi:MAG: putative lipid II flippase FtsW [Kiritimatiellae bacterium]|nr:putative lipid II flippase FtsW [Kiritimatiellia bacterium]